MVILRRRRSDGSSTQLAASRCRNVARSQPLEGRSAEVRRSAAMVWRVSFSGTKLARAGTAPRLYERQNAGRRKGGPAAAAAPPSALTRSEEPLGDDGEATACVACAGDEVRQSPLAVEDHKGVRPVVKRQVGRYQHARGVDCPRDPASICQRPGVDIDLQSAGAAECDGLLQVRATRIRRKCRWQSETQNAQQRNGE